MFLTSGFDAAQGRRKIPKFRLTFDLATVVLLLL